MDAEIEDKGLVQQRVWAERITLLLDTRFRIPYTNVRFGIDPILGLLPVVGDVASAIVTAVIIIIYVRLGVPNHVAWRMVANLLVDMVIGSIPILGSIFDVGFRANTRNLKLAKAYFGTNAK